MHYSVAMGCHAGFRFNALKPLGEIMYILCDRYEVMEGGFNRLKGESHWFYIFHSPIAYQLDKDNKLWIPKLVGWEKPSVLSSFLF